MKDCTNNINDILPIIDDNMDYDPNNSMTCKDIKKELGIPENEESADFYIHYTTCKYIVIEEFSKRKSIEKAIRQIEKTLNYIKKNGQKVEFIAIVYDKLNDIDARNFVCKPGNILYSNIIGKVEPIKIDGLELRCYTKSQIKDLRKYKRI